MNVKQSSVRRLLGALGLEARGWEAIDHWEADECAIGIAPKATPRLLVYVSTFGKAEGMYDYECEVPSGPAGVDYVTADRGEDVTLEQLLTAMERHFAG